MMNNRSRLTALETGASSGIGKSIAKRLIADGYLVYVAARSTDKMADLAQLGAVPLTMDISKEAGILAAVATITERSGGVDVLVNNAGYGPYGPVEDIALDEARYQFEVNVFGPDRPTQLLLPSMQARGKGTIVNITSMGGKVYRLLGVWYHATKHAQEGWSDSLRLEVDPFGIRAIVIEPGQIETGFGEAAGRGLAERSRNTAYAKLAERVAAVMERTYGHGSGTDPEVIADVFGDAAKSSKTKTCRAAGKYAKRDDLGAQVAGRPHVRPADQAPDVTDRDDDPIHRRQMQAAAGLLACGRADGPVCSCAAASGAPAGEPACLAGHMADHRAVFRAVAGGRGAVGRSCDRASDDDPDRKCRPPRRRRCRPSSRGTTGRAAPDGAVQAPVHSRGTCDRGASSFYGAFRGWAGVPPAHWKELH